MSRRARCPLPVLLAALTLSGAAAATAAGEPVQGQVTYVTADAVYLDLGAAQGLEPGATLTAIVNGAQVARLQVVQVAPHSSVARVLEQKRPLRPQTRVRGQRLARPAPPAPPVVALRASAVPALGAETRAYTPLPFAGTTTRAAWTPLRDSAHLRSGTWIAFGVAEGLSQREQLDLALQGPLDAAGRWQVDLLASAAVQPLSPAQGRFRQGSWGWLEVQRAGLSYRPLDALSLQLGRRVASNLRFGLVDGVGATWHAGDDGPRVSLLAGTQPTRSDLLPGYLRPLAALGVDGQARWGWGSLRYQWDLSSLWEVGRGSDGGESAVRLDLDGRAGWHLAADLGGLLLPDDGDGQLALIADRAALSTAWRFGRFQLGACGRRLDDRLRWPDAPPGAPRLEPEAALYDGSVFADVSQRLGPLLGGVSLSGGGGVSEDGSWPRAWVAPSLWTRLPWLGSALRLQYRGEWSPVGNHLASAALGVDPLDGLHLGLHQEGGVYLLESSRQLLWTGTSGVRASVRVLGKGQAGLRADLRYGDLAGVELWAWIAVLDLL